MIVHEGFPVLLAGERAFYVRKAHWKKEMSMSSADSIGGKDEVANP
jgi:hypothetical protein